MHVFATLETNDVGLDLHVVLESHVSTTPHAHPSYQVTKSDRSRSRYSCNLGLQVIDVYGWDDARAIAYWSISLDSDKIVITWIVSWKGKNGIDFIVKV